MGLTGLEIYKQLPKKNCGECGPPTCLAFAMNLASGKAALDSCPYVTDAAKEALESAAAPPIALVKAGTGDYVVEMGDETELFRHDKKFYHEAAYAIKVSDSLSEEEISEKVKKVNNLVIERVGMQYKSQFVAIDNQSGSADAFVKAVEIANSITDMPLVLISTDVPAVAKALEIVADKKPLVYAATEDNYEEMTKLAKDKDVPLAVYAEGLDALAELVQKVVNLGHKQLVLDPGSKDLSQTIANLVQIRRQAIKKKFRPFGYPIMAFTQATDPLEEVVEAVALTGRYASIVVMDTTDPAHMAPLMSWRQNLYTDPQVPIQVEEKIYAVGDVNENSPVYVTTNFSLSFYTVQGEVESSKIPSYIIPINTDGTSVLTAYSAGKYEPEQIAAVLKKVGIEDKVSHRNVVIPGLVAVVSGKLEDSSGWKVIVGPREASGIPSFAKSQFA
ncbi:MAG: acetyl-CoA decarbonylase/synthase complex subunit gamma [Desulfitibacter sp. BRH_c19]|nr:MAG: acetyl-CoA decarbonylase/synthase complex subunit gamma [Desulfitibacter sp. BRH_c19]